MPPAERTAAAPPSAPVTAGTRLATVGHASTVLSAFVVLLIAVPPRLVLGPLGGAGAPAAVVALGCAGWWVLDRCTRPFGQPLHPPVRFAVLVVLAAFSASYVVAMTRAIGGPEYSVAQLNMVLLLGWCGVALVADDGISTTGQLIALLRRLVAMTACMTTLGAAQFVTGEQLVDHLTIPGLHLNGDSVALISREGFSRPAGTALHPIEYGSVVTMVLPIAITLALHDHSRHWLRRWVPVGLIALAVPLSISRSAIVATVVGLLVLALTWSPLQRWLALASSGALVLAVFVAVPGMVGSLASLFTGVGADTSTQSRTGSYAIVAEYVERSPWWGRGFGTFLPTYRILDNEILLLCIEVGLVGAAAFTAMVLTGVVVAVRARRLAIDPLVSALGQALAASLLAALCTMALFDGLGFSMTASCLFLLLGVAGALYRLVREQALAVPLTAAPTSAT